MRTDSKNLAMLVTTSFSWCKNGVSPFFPPPRSSVKNRSKNRSSPSWPSQCWHPQQFRKQQAWRFAQRHSLEIESDTLQGINISHLGKRKIIFKMPFLGDMLVSWRVIVLTSWSNWEDFSKTFEKKSSPLPTENPQWGRFILPPPFPPHFPPFLTQRFFL